MPATIMALEGVIKEVQGHILVFLDGGARRGIGVFETLAVGAAGIFIGRPVVFSLAAEGEAVVRKVLQMMRDELELTRSVVVVHSRRSPVTTLLLTEPLLVLLTLYPGCKNEGKCLTVLSSFTCRVPPGF